MLVILRLCLGCHFLYEGVWKIKHHDEFTAEPFLTEAKGPASPLFYAMLPDIDGRQRLTERDDKGQVRVSGKQDLAAAAEYHQRFVAHYGLSEEQKTEAERELYRFQNSVDDFLAAHRAEILAHFKKLDLHEANVAEGNDGTPHQQKRLWDKQQELRKEARQWCKDLDDMQVALQASLKAVLTSGQQAGGAMIRWNPLEWTRVEQINFAVTYGLTAIGLCLMLGFCTRLAALGGGAFMAFVVATQPSWPTIYPPAPPVVGHALLINKDFVEMVSLFLLATTAAGRWGGLDVFLYRWLGRPMEKYLAERA